MAKGAAKISDKEAKEGKDGGRKAQYAALPWRRGEAGLEVLLITSRETRRWVIPKGWPMKGRKPFEAAAQEAFEEAGVIGVVKSRKTGAYRYEKRLKNGKLRLVHVNVYPLKVREERDRWPEMAEREKKWVTPTEAAAMVDEPELQSLIAGFAPG